MRDENKDFLRLINRLTMQKIRKNLEQKKKKVLKEGEGGIVGR